MSSVLADFGGRFDVESEGVDGPSEGRILLGKGQLVLAVDEGKKTTISLDSIVDINPGAVPNVFDPLPGSQVTVAYKKDGSHRVALVASDETTIRKFTTILFKAILNGTGTTIKHPAKLGGRVLDTDYQAGILALETGTVKIDTDEGPVLIDLDGVIDYSQDTQSVGGDERSVIAVSHMSSGDAMTTIVTTKSRRKLMILGRYLQREYRTLMESLEDISLSDAETEVLTTIYSAGDVDISLTGVLDIEPRNIKRLLHALHGKGLIESGDNGPVLTSKGQVVVNHYLERINE